MKCDVESKTSFYALLRGRRSATAAQRSTGIHKPIRWYKKNNARITHLTSSGLVELVEERNERRVQLRVLDGEGLWDVMAEQKGLRERVIT